MLIKNVKIENADTASDLRVENGSVCEITQNAVPMADEMVIDGQGGLLLPPFVDSHVHLDTCLSAVVEDATMRLECKNQFTIYLSKKAAPHNGG